MIELARAQDEEVGDGTTSVIITAGEILTAVEGFLEREIHPTVIVSAYFKALEEIVRITEQLGVSFAEIFRAPCQLWFWLHYYRFKQHLNNN